MPCIYLNASRLGYFPEDFITPLRAVLIFFAARNTYFRRNVRAGNFNRTTSFLLDMGTQVNTVQQPAGHSKSNIHASTYGHSQALSAGEAFERIEELISQVAVKLQVIMRPSPS